MKAFPTDPAGFLAAVHGEIPLTRHLGLQALEREGDALCTEFALAPNLNLHGTAFAGSLYSACVLSGWSLATLLLCPQLARPEVVLRNGAIRHHRPVRDDFRVRCQARQAAAVGRYRARVAQGRIARIDLVAHVGPADDAQVWFEGTYVCLPAGE